MKLVLAPLIGFCLLRAQNGPNPFEAIPQPPERPKAIASGPTIQTIEFRGARRVPTFLLHVLIASRVGGAYDVETLQHDTQAIYNTGRFSHVVWESEPGPAGAVIRFLVVERPLIESLQCQGDNTVTAPEISERLDQRKIKLKVETLYNENELPRAVDAVRDLLTEKGRQNFTVTPLVERIGPPSTVKITFRIDDAK